jgi:uncharacterized protein GlcG (DUF336 family)
MQQLTLQQAGTIVDAVLAKGREMNLLPLTVAVLDSGGHLVAFKREDGSGILRPEIAIGKAWASLGMGTPTRKLRDRLVDRPTFVNALSVASGGRLIPVPGGVLIRNQDRKIIGATGVSGDTSDKDEFCAIEGVRAAGLFPDPEIPAPGWADSTFGPNDQGEPLRSG